MLRTAPIFLALVCLAACSSQEPPPTGFNSYGPPSLFQTPDGRSESFHGAEGGWGPPNFRYQPMTPGNLRPY